MKFTRNIYQLGLGNFPLLFLVTKDETFIYRTLVHLLSAHTLVTFYKISVAAASSWIPMSWEMYTPYVDEVSILLLGLELLINSKIRIVRLSKNLLLRFHIGKGGLKNQ